MTKKQLISILIIFIPLILIQVYDGLFYNSGDWTEDYQNYFKFGFLLLSLVGIIALIFSSRVIEKYSLRYFWYALSGVLLILWIFYFVLAGIIVNMSK